MYSKLFYSKQLNALRNMLVVKLNTGPSTTTKKIAQIKKEVGWSSITF